MKEMHNYLQDKLEAERMFSSHIRQLQLLYDKKSDEEKKRIENLVEFAKSNGAICSVLDFVTSD